MNAELRRKVRVLKSHDVFEDDDYHEWVERADGMNDCEMLDRLGRSGNRGWFRWDYWRCNNSSCEALALVCGAAIDDAVSGWLKEADSDSRFHQAKNPQQ